MHQRQLILQELTKILVAKNVCGGNIYNSRTRPALPEDLPAIFLYALNESNDVEYLNSTNYAEYRRTLELVLDIKMYQIDYLDAKTVFYYLDDVARQLEFILNENRTLNSNCSILTLQSTRLATDQESEKIIGSCELTCECIYYADAMQIAEDADLPDYLLTAVEKTYSQTIDKQLIKMR